MTEEEKKEFEEFLQWKKEKQARLQKVSSTDEDKEVQETSLTEEAGGKPINHPELTTGQENTADNGAKENGNNSALLFIGFIAAVIIIIVLLFTCQKKKELPQLTPNEYAAVEDSTEAAEVAVPEPEPEKVLWSITEEKDEMTDSKNIWATINSNNSITQDFPYEGYTYAFITVRYMKKYGYDVLIRISQGQINGRSYYGTDYITARFDEGTPKKYYFDEAADGSSETVFLRNSSDFIKKCKQAKDIKIDIPIYQGGRPVFTFHVDEPLVWPE